MSKMRFRYPLEPVLLTRQWALDALLQTLAEHNAGIAEHARRQAATQAAYAAASAGWQALTAAREAQSVQGFLLASRYLADVAARMRDEADEMARLAAARDEVIAQVVAARRAVEAVEQHRDDMQRAFVRQRLSADLKLADDQWNTLQTGKTGAASHGH